MAPTARQIKDFARRIGRDFGARRIYLFGSRVAGNGRADSDVDLLIVMPHHGARVEQAVAIRMALRPSFPVDLIIRSPKEIQARLRMGDTFIRDILETGKLLYEADHG
jgi:predicted nucleotidyltransferase